jgi:hypothetical protein
VNGILLLAVLFLVLWAAALTLRAAHIVRAEGRALNGGQR